MRPEQPVYGLMDTWQHHEINYSGTTYSNMLNSLEWSTADSQGINNRSEGFEFGWESRYSADPREENAYWVEYDGTSYEYHNLSSVPGGSGTVGRLYTYMIVPGEGSQSALYFDFNPVGNTTKAESARIRESSGGLFAETIEAAAFAGSFEHRVQLLDGNDVWRRPWVSETSTRETYPCDAPRNAPATGGPNTAPRCLNASTVTKSGSTPIAVDYFKISKPAVAPLQSAPFVSSATGGDYSYNGVNQRALADCMAADPGRCMDDVPGLAECVKAHKSCNMNARWSAAQRSDPSAAITEKQALGLAQKVLTKSGNSLAVTAKARTFSAQDYARTVGVSAYAENSADIIVVAGGDTVRGLLGRQLSGYRGYALAFDSASGSLLHACLGAACLSYPMV
ncbi:hypothetical protein ACSNOB_17870 [Micromonospora sp. URMC 106]|uniref:hypothetical protein n=1 Tax=Micromonospora sp. URMC 106 TaxID=3423408 RepID=UPI003F1D7E91